MYNGTATGSPWGARSINGYVDGYLVYADAGKTTLLSCSSAATGAITIPESVTSIENYAFSDCTGLTSVTIPNSVTTIGSDAFYNVPNVLYNGTATGSPWGAKSVNGFVEDYLVYADATKSTLLACYRSATGAVTIPNSVTSIGKGAFSGCTGLTSVTIGNSVTSIGEWAFSGCTGLTSVTIPNSVTSIGSDAFSSCTGLTSITIPNSVTSIGEDAFFNVFNIMYNGTATGSPWGARNVNGYVDGYLVYADVTKSTLLACYTSATGAVTIPNSVMYIENSAFNGCTGLTSVTIGNSVTSIGEWAFSGCTGLTSVTIGNSVTSIGDCAFMGCAGLTSITIPESVTSIGNSAFAGCTGLTSVTIPNSVTSIGEGAFNGCTGLTSVTIPNSVTTIGMYAFYNCMGLTSVTIGNSVTSIGESAFFDCSGLTSITIPNSVTTIGMYAFYNCMGLTSVTIGNSVTSIGESAFFDCSGLTSITIPNSVTTIGMYAFYNCMGLTSVTIGNSVTSIGSYTFYGCTGLTSIAIPNSVTSIGAFAFSGCINLFSISILAEIPPLYCSDSYTDYWEGVSTDIPVYIPCGTKDAYQADCGWGRFSNYIEPVAPYSLTVTTQDEMMGTAHIIRQTTCANDTAVFEAVANDGYHFTQWSDGNTDNPRTIVVDEDITLTAQFVSSPTAIDNTLADTDTSTTHKVLRNGRVYILHNGKTYTIVGIEVK